MINTSLRILLIEDQKTDVVLIKRQLKKLVRDPKVKVAEDLQGCRSHLVNFGPDVVISDYNLPTCNGLEILELTKSIDPDVPFIFLTGTINDEELAANTILAGATGYILKKHIHNLEEKLKPLLKKVAFNMVAREDVREKVRQNKIAVNQIYNYLDNLNADNSEQLKNISKIKDTIGDFKMDEEDEEE
ncbi:response regulator [Salegentibacter chungangensis]|uniref:Response regulator n=1 Tax=Salegentibacter chungangensis TaxID=1335724 RepID=A0ABW3NTU5_9FLAO